MPDHPPGGAIRVALVEDHDDLRAAFAGLIDGAPDLECVGATPSGEDAVARFPDLDPDVILMDINLPGMSGVECVRALSDRDVRAQIVMLTAFEDSESIFESMKAGATGYILKRAPALEILDAVRQVHGGAAPMTGSVARKLVEYFSAGGGSDRTVRPTPAGGDAASADPTGDAARLASLTEREWEVLELLAGGRLYKQIALDLSISVNTVRKHIRGIYAKLHVSSRTKAVRKFLER